MVYAVSGQRIAVLADRIASPGTFNAVWDGSRASSGVYMIILKAGNRQMQRKCLLAK
jgi:hypothetical protein